MIDRGEEVNTVELAIISLEYASLDHTKYLDHFYHVLLFGTMGGNAASIPHSNCM